MATTVWKGHLTFGLISIPIHLFAAARSQRINFHELHKECDTRIRMPLFCPTCNRIVERSEIVKGYEYEKDQYVLFTEEELDRMEPESARTMEILQFVKLEDVDPIYFDASYYAAPEDAGRKAYQLLFKAMEELRVRSPREALHAPPRIHRDHPPSREGADIAYDVLFE